MHTTCQVCGKGASARLIVIDEEEWAKLVDITACEHHIASIINEAMPGEMIKVIRGQLSVFASAGGI